MDTKKSSDGVPVEQNANSSNSASNNPASNNEAPPPYTQNHAETQPLIPSASAAQPSTPTLLVIESRGPTELICPFEGVQITTIPSHKPGLKSGFCSAIFCFVFWPLFWLPLVTVSCQDEIHTCPNCKRIIAISR